MKKIINILLIFAILLNSFYPFMTVFAEECTGYQLATVASDGNVTNISCYANYGDSKAAMLAHESTDSLVAVIYYGGRIVNAKYAIAKIIPKSSSTTITIYTNSTDRVKYTYMDTLSASDAAFIDYDATTNMAKIRISGYSGWVDLNNITIEPISTLMSNMVRINTDISLNVRTSPTTSASNIIGSLYKDNSVKYYEKVNAEGYTWYRIIFNGVSAWFASGEGWTTEISGMNLQTFYSPYAPSGNLIHYFEYRSGSSPAQSYTNLGTKPSFLQSSEIYYSFDGIYYYTNILNMLDDYRIGTNLRSLNKNNPYYAYYLYLPNHSKTGYTKDDFNQAIKNKGYNSNVNPDVRYVKCEKDINNNCLLDANGNIKWINTWEENVSRSGISLLYGKGQALVDVANTYGINALMMYGTAVNESASGTSIIAFAKKNLFGIGAVDSNPFYGASSYNTVEDSFVSFARLSGTDYSNPELWKYSGSHYGNKGSGMNINYAADPYWGEKQAQNSFLIDFNFGKQDFQANTVGIKTNLSNIPIRKSPNNLSPIIYKLKNNYNNREIDNIPIIVYDKVYTTESGITTGWYKVYTDTALDDNQNIANVDYNFNKSYGYIREDHIYVSNNQPTINAEDITVMQGRELDLLNGVTSSDLENGDLTSKIKVTGEYDIFNVGTYDLTYTVEDNSRFSTSKNIILNVVKSDSPYIVATNRQISKFTSFDPRVGVTAFDEFNNDITSSIEIISNNVNTEELGTYKVTYRVTDSLNKTITKEINVYVLENQKPVINAIDKTIIKNNIFVPMQGVTASDFEDGNLTNSITVKSNNVDTSKPGIYNVIYEVTDSTGAVATKTIRITVEDQTYINRAGDFYFNRMEWVNNRLVVEGSLAMTEMNNVGTIDIKYDLVLSDSINGSEYVLPLERWLNDHPSRAYTDNRYDYSKSWFKGNLELNNVAQGDYVIYVRARSGNLESKNLFRNMMGKTMVRKAIDSNNNRGYLFRNNNYKNTYPIELSVRNDGLISSVQPPHQSNMFNTYDSLDIVNGYLNIIGKSYNITGDYSTDATVERYLIFENTSTFSKYQFNIGSFVGSNIPLRVDDGKSKVKAWFNTENKVNLTTLPEGNYKIYIRTKTGNVDDYGELNDVFMKNIANSTISTEIKSLYYSNRNYSIFLNKNARFRIELNIKK